MSNLSFRVHHQDSSAFPVFLIRIYLFHRAAVRLYKYRAYIGGLHKGYLSALFLTAKTQAVGIGNSFLIAIQKHTPCSHLRAVEQKHTVQNLDLRLIPVKIRRQKYIQVPISVFPGFDCAAVKGGCKFRPPLGVRSPCLLSNLYHTVCA